ncbi:hypothetical protein [Kitasatospora sp. SUK 42]|uniref:hypothetical protein n=1 Tax=Kitasatospora sp. SUK 42 TaxID=1588882 RepID=UPI0018C8EEFB|nr:hypothetical protein [Kitasatospora sp. SUK 42]MBV2156720.1 hypothetical protein [Kitasatospora sp. SUK 42]
MRPEDVPLLFQELAREFADVTDMSVAATGSLARGDHRTGPTGDIVSNLDLIHVVADGADVPETRAVVERRMRRISDTFRIETTSVIARLPAFRLAGHAHYRISMRPEWFCDGLGLGPATFGPPGDDGDPQAPLAWMMQPVPYYLAKATILDPTTNLAKARRAATRLADRFDLKGIRDDLDNLPRALRTLIAERDLTPLGSTTRYLDTPTHPAIAQLVRDAVFVECMGLPSADSMVTVLPSVPN